MRKTFKRILIVGLFAFVGIQFIPAELNQQTDVSRSDFSDVYDVTDNVMNILEASCYDCHSNNTNYPWYSQIQPIRMMMDYHVEDGKDELNFSEFGNYSERRKRNKLRAISEQIRESKMPISSYALMHQEARLTETDRELLIDWIDNATPKHQ